MNSHQRVALRHTKRQALEFVISDETYNDSILLEVEMGDQVVGEVMATFEEYEVKYIQSRLYPCSDDIMQLLSYLGGELLSHNGKIKVVEVISSVLDASMRSQGIGYQMYLKVAQEAFERNNRLPLLFLPNYCTGHSTSDKALKVWESLARKYTSEGHVIAIRRRPKK